MNIVRRANVVLKVRDEEVDKYLARGFSLLNENGEVIRSATPNDLATFKEAYIRQSKEIEELNSQIEELNSQIEELKAELEKARQKKSKTKQVEE